MAYTVVIRRNRDGLVRHYEMPLTIVNGDIGWWQRHNGNFGCDCNRHDTFERAGGTTEEELEAQDEAGEIPCGHSAYTVIELRLPDGTVLPVDDEEEPCRASD